MLEHLVPKTKGTAGKATRHRARFAAGAIMVPMLGPRRRSSQDAALERQLEVLDRSVKRQAEEHSSASRSDSA